MFDNRWDNWSGDFAESFAATQLHSSVRNHVPEILAHFGNEVRGIDPSFPDGVSPETFIRVLTESMPRLRFGDEARRQIPEVIASFLEYLAESGRLGEGTDWARQVRAIRTSAKERPRPEGTVKGVTIKRNPKVSPLGRNDPCPCGSGKKFKKCCMD